MYMKHNKKNNITQNRTQYKPMSCI